VGRNQYCSCEIGKPRSILESMERKHAKRQASWRIAAGQVKAIDKWIGSGISGQ